MGTMPNSSLSNAVCLSRAEYVYFWKEWKMRYLHLRGIDMDKASLLDKLENNHTLLEKVVAQASEEREK